MTNLSSKSSKNIFDQIKRKREPVMSWDRVELWWVMILKVIPHLILKKAHLITALQEFFILKNFLKFYNQQSNLLTFHKETWFNPSGTLTNFGLFGYASSKVGMQLNAQVAFFGCVPTSWNNDTFWMKQCKTSLVFINLQSP